MSLRFLSNRYFLLSVKVLLALGISFLVNQFDLFSFESWTYDMRVRLTPPTPISDHIRLIQIDQKTLKKMGGTPHIEAHSQLLNHLIEAKPKYIIYVSDLDEAKGTTQEKLRLAKSVKKFDNLYAIINRYKANEKVMVKGQNDVITLKPPLDKIKTENAFITIDDNKFSRDNVTRRVILKIYDKPYFFHTVAKDFNHIKDPEDYQGAFPFLYSYQSYIDFRPTGTYPTFSFADVYQQSLDQDNFKDKIVLIGNNTLADAKDYKLTPYSREVVAMPNLEVHANILDTLIQNTSPIPSHKSLTYWITAFISIITLLSVFNTRPVKGLVIILSTTILYLLTTYLSFFFFHYVLDVSHVLLTIFISYYFFIPYRLIQENRRSWEYQQHNRLLKQVEELKTNFLRMMSHDLKTPLARIQGMTDMVLNEKNRLSDQQSSALKSINKSSQELSLFIGSILDLSRIESNEVKLQLHSKDINALIRKVIGRCQFLAKEKNIQIFTELEPLFSLKFDEDLMHQVITNLIENAIKYSPENSKILVSSEEIDGKIIIQVADQGIGIDPEDRDHIFTKFYRSQNAKTSNISGSGLGLYLSKYFVNLHQGQIHVESEPKSGSTFTIELPMN